MRRNVARGMTFVLALGMILVSFAPAIYAGVPPAATPEIDGSTIVAGLGLLGAGAMLVRARRRSK
jgi:uncharacterized protein (TIGR03382 family)